MKIHCSAFEVLVGNAGDDFDGLVACHEEQLAAQAAEDTARRAELRPSILVDGVQHRTIGTVRDILCAHARLLLRTQPRPPSSGTYVVAFGEHGIVLAMLTVEAD